MNKTSISHPSFTVLLSVYHGEQPQYLRESLASLVNQTLKPSEIVIVKDGLISSELQSVIDAFSASNHESVRQVHLDENKGLGIALNYGLTFCTNDYVARMDTDDICLRDRFQQQIEFLEKNPNIDIVGSSIYEFIDNPDQWIREKKSPVLHDQILKYSRYRNPMNHMTVLFKRHSVIRAGGYRNFRWFEDYDLWTRMLQAGMRFHNIKAPLVNVRIGNDMIGKRRGWEYMVKELAFLKHLCKENYISKAEFLFLIVSRLPLRLIPKWMLTFVYKKILR